MKIFAIVSLDLHLYLERTSEFLKHFQNKYSINTYDTLETEIKVKIELLYRLALWNSTKSYLIFPL